MFAHCTYKCMHFFLYLFIKISNFHRYTKSIHSLQSVPKSVPWRNIIITNISHTVVSKTRFSCLVLLVLHQMHFILSGLNIKFPIYGTFTDMGANCSLATCQHFSAVKRAFVVTKTSCLNLYFSYNRDFELTNIKYDLLCLRAHCMTASNQWQRHLQTSSVATKSQSKLKSGWTVIYTAVTITWQYLRNYVVKCDGMKCIRSRSNRTNNSCQSVFSEQILWEIILIVWFLHGEPSFGTPSAVQFGYDPETVPERYMTWNLTGKTIAI